MSRAPRWKKEEQVPRRKEQLREWGRYQDGSLSMPVAPRNELWDHDRQIDATGDILSRPSFVEWALQRSCYGAGVPGAERPEGKTVCGRQLGREGAPAGECR
jgi:hypothetical protein